MLRRLVTIVVVCAAACGTATHDPRLTAIEPPIVTSLVATPAIVRGEELDALTTLDLDTSKPAAIDRGWQVRIGGAAVDSMWVDRQRLDITIPRGITAGVYDVLASAPDGRELVLPRALTVTAEPVGLALAIEDAPGGTGGAVAGTIAAGDQVTAFAVVRDAQKLFIADVAVEWGTTTTIGTLSSASGTSVTLTGTRVGTGELTAHHAGAALDTQSGALTVIAGPATHVAIEDTAGGGATIGDVTGLTTDVNGGLTAHAVSRDAFGNFTGDVPVAWSLTGVTGTLPVVDLDVAAVDFATPGVGVLHAQHATLGAAATGSLTVVAGRAASLTIVPGTKALGADDPPFAFGVTAVDGDGNPTTNLGTLTWSIASGPITAIGPATGVLDPTAAGTGTLGVASSFGPTAVSGVVTIAPGAATSVVVSPPTLTTSADDPATTFTAAISDADGNSTSPGTLTWSISSGPITSIGPATGVFDPQSAGTGTVMATASNGTTGTAAVTVQPGHAAVLAISPNTLVASQGGAAVPFTATATDADGNATTDVGTVTWSIASGPIAAINGANGILQPTTPGTGSIKATSSYGATSTTGSIQILSAASLGALLTAPAQVSVGQTFSLSMQVTNGGEDGAANVAACPLVIGGTGTATIGTVPAPVPTLAPGAGTTLIWTVTATGAGTLTFTTCANATDAVTGVPISTPASASTNALLPPQLDATLSIPSLLGRAASFTVTMIVTNNGQVAANGVTPSALTTTGTGTIMLTSAPPLPASIGPGASATFQWTYRATTLGTVQLHGTASGSDANSGSIVSTPNTDSNLADIVEAFTAMDDPFGDSTAFGFVAGYRGEVYVGPNRTGSAAFRIQPDYTSPESVSFSFSRDVTGGSQSANPSTPSTSIGAPGCTPNTPTCGPDNETQRGLFTNVTFGGNEWLVISGAKALGASYFYMTTSSASPLGFRYVDLSAIVSSADTYGISAVGTVGNRLYVGTAGINAGRSKLVSVTAPPPSPGLDATGSNATDMTLEHLGSWGNGGNPGNVDAIANVGGLAYVANKHAWIRADAQSPVPMPDTCLLCCVLGCQIDWIDITPSASAYNNKTSRSTVKTGGLEPVDRAVPQIVQFGNRLFAARNTTTGPQLWACTLSNSRCDSNDWALVAANSTGDPQLTQFNDPTLTSITMLAATPTFLYVGFDSASGVQVFRTSNPAATTRGAFEGTSGCSAANHPGSCAGYGGAGLGDVTNTRIFDGKALTFGAQSAVWLTVGDGTNPLALVTLL